jgi:hypothetical protein
MFRLSVADELRQRLEIIPTGGEQVTAPLTDLLDQSIDEHGPRAFIAHPPATASRGSPPAASFQGEGFAGQSLCASSSTTVSEIQASYCACWSTHYARVNSRRWTLLGSVRVLAYALGLVVSR